MVCVFNACKYNNARQLHVQSNRQLHIHTNRQLQVQTNRQLQELNKMQIHVENRQLNLQNNNVQTRQVVNGT